MENKNSGLILDKSGLAPLGQLIRLPKDIRPSMGTKHTKAKSEDHKQFSSSSSSSSSNSSRVSSHQRASSTTSSRNQGEKVHNKLRLYVEGLPVISSEEKHSKASLQRSSSAVKFNFKLEDPKLTTHCKVRGLSTKSLKERDSIKGRESYSVPDSSYQGPSSTSYIVGKLKKKPALSLDVLASAPQQLNYITPHNSRRVRKQLLSPISGTEEQRSRQIEESPVQSRVNTTEKKQAATTLQESNESQVSQIELRISRITL